MMMRARLAIWSTFLLPIVIAAAAAIVLRRRRRLNIRGRLPVPPVVPNVAQRRRVCVAASGSVAAVKIPRLVEQLICIGGARVDLVLTHSADFFLGTSYQGTTGREALEVLMGLRDQHGEKLLQVYRDADEWNSYREVGKDSVLHVELAKRNELLLVAPLCAHTLATLALGLAPSLLGSLVRAWRYDVEPEFARSLLPPNGTSDMVAKPIIVAPAMNTTMWYQRLTAQHLSVLRSRGVEVVPPIAKTLACGDHGNGAMADVDTIIQMVMMHLPAEL
eukprot:NODE_1385_length_940_cov_333.679012_g1068_i0.p1 GENE.NODE_1385_length_940_cov_333.679012_g1068_i0~~NODE_1385_length_940_cov_333.679012_g1068_i0.p1  ORF type:complete len:298 (+),score=69.41 NODE_1385_length_940_cov_333.679012_g1068_i0:68-895(+)